MESVSVYDTELVYDTETETVTEVVESTEVPLDKTVLQELPEIPVEEIGTETGAVVNYYVTEQSVDNNQLTDITVCLVVIIVALGAVFGATLGKILWGCFK